LLFVISIGYQPSLMLHYLVGGGLTCVRMDVLCTHGSTGYVHFYIPTCIWRK